MSIEEYLTEMKNIKQMILDILDDDNENIDRSIKILNNKTLSSTIPYKALSIFQIIIHITNEHHRGPNFFLKIEQILNNFKNEIKNFDNSDIFEIFKSNKRIILYLIKEKLLILDKTCTKKISNLNSSYREYFAPEMKGSTQLADDFEENREIGENNSYICKLIRNDSIENFIIYVNEKNITPNSYIKKSIFESNSLLQNPTSLIEYAAFYGSIRIFRYLLQQGVPLKKSLIYAIHSNNPEIISICENEKNDQSLIYEAFYE